mmetsp:Transcript_27091/g.40878  ORF Transcript_27091/g.40878 Transcript_27091/m.40878 type:complete len:214 (+) Transcript_27091:367-1008(+)
MLHLLAHQVAVAGKTLAQVLQHQLYLLVLQHAGRIDIVRAEELPRLLLTHQRALRKDGQRHRIPRQRMASGGGADEIGVRPHLVESRKGALEGEDLIPRVGDVRRRAEQIARRVEADAARSIGLEELFGRHCGRDDQLDRVVVEGVDHRDHPADLVDVAHRELRHLLDHHRVEGGRQPEVILRAERPAAQPGEGEARHLLLHAGEGYLKVASA